MENKANVKPGSSKEASKKHRPPPSAKNAKKQRTGDSKGSYRDIDAERHPEEQIVSPDGPWNKDLKRRNDPSELI